MAQGWLACNQGLSFGGSAMITRVQRWGNSQGLRLSNELLSDVDRSVGDAGAARAQTAAQPLPLFRDIR